ncbi:hypothetical protein ACWGKS_29475 [Nocardiopsis sp. NPDC055879]
MYESSNNELSPVEEQEAISGMASSLSGYLPENWKWARFFIMFMGEYAIRRVEVEKEDGEVTRISLPTSFIMRAMEIRSGMYKQNRGTWFSWELMLWSEGRYKSKFNYTDLPPFTFGPDSDDFLEEMRIFPRSEEFIPGWLQEKIDEANRGE